LIIEHWYTLRCYKSIKSHSQTVFYIEEADKVQLTFVVDGPADDSGGVKISTVDISASLNSE